MDDFMKWVVILAVALLAWSWLRRGISGYVGPAQTFGGPDMFASGFVPMGRGGLEFGANIPWTWGQ